MKFWVLDELFMQAKLGLSIDGKFWCYLNKVCMTMRMPLCIVVYYLYKIVQLHSCLKLHLKFV
jgi:hypothetical protein